MGDESKLTRYLSYVNGYSLFKYILPPSWRDRLDQWNENHTPLAVNIFGVLFTIVIIVALWYAQQYVKFAWFLLVVIIVLIVLRHGALVSQTLAIMQKGIVAVYDVVKIIVDKIPGV